MRQEDGGPVFPSPIATDGDGNVMQPQYWGMSLRDWFAGQALAGMHAYGVDNIVSRNTLDWDADIAKRAYDAADAMLRARQGGDDGE